MKVLVIAEHNNSELNPSTLNTVTAGSQLGEVDILIAGENSSAVASAAAQVSGVKKVLHAEAAHYAQILAEELTPLAIKLAADYDYVIAPATNFGKNLMPRIAALLDVAQISDITEILSAEYQPQIAQI